MGRWRNLAVSVIETAPLADSLRLACLIDVSITESLTNGTAGCGYLKVLVVGRYRRYSGQPTVALTMNVSVSEVSGHSGNSRRQLVLQLLLQRLRYALTQPSPRTT